MESTISDPLPEHRWIDVSARIGGDDPDLAFCTAVHIAIYWAQDLCGGPITRTTHPASKLTKKLKRGLPLPNEEVRILGDGRWPPSPEAFSLDCIPRVIPITEVKEGTATWTLDDERLLLTKSVVISGTLLTHDIEITAGPQPMVRQRAREAGRGKHDPGVPVSLKLMAAICGLFDGNTRFTPEPLLVHTEEDVELFLNVLKDPERRQPLIAVAADDGSPDDTWLPDVEQAAKNSIMLQHFAAITKDGLTLINDALGSHGMAPGAIKTFRAGFSSLDIPDRHPATSRGAVADHHLGRAGMLERWRKRLMTTDASER